MNAIATPNMSSGTEKVEVVKTSSASQKARNKVYKDSGRQLTNKAKKLLKVLANNPNDQSARTALKAIPASNLKTARNELRAAGAKFADLVI